MVDLLRTFSNPEIRRSTESILRSITRQGQEENAPARPRQLRARHGQIEQLVAEVVTAAAGPVSVEAIHAGLEHRCGEEVSRSSVNNALTRLARRGTIDRLARGRYVGGLSGSASG